MTQRKTIKLSGVIIDKAAPSATGHVYNWDAISIPETLPVNLNFDRTNLIGTANNIRVDNNVLIADMEISNTAVLMRTYPAISGIIREQEGNVIKAFDLTSVSLCGTKNVDPSIKSLEEQLGFNPNAYIHHTLLNQVIDIINNFKLLTDSTFTRTQLIQNFRKQQHNSIDTYRRELEVCGYLKKNSRGVYVILKTIPWLTTTQLRKKYDSLIALNRMKENKYPA